MSATTWELTVPGGSAATRVLRPGMAVGTDQQEAFWDELTHGSENVVLKARAGSGKSYSCREGMARLTAAGASPERIRYTAFNKSIADEFRAKAPPGCDVGTFHSFCLRALMTSLSDRPTIDGLKTYRLLDADSASKGLSRPNRKTVAKLVSAAKNAAIDPFAFGPAEGVGRLFDLLERMDPEAAESDGERIAVAAMRALQAAAEQTTVIDFDDMIWLAWLRKSPHPPCDIFMVDEAQDLNPLQHEVLRLMAANGRVVAVGDPRQSIYLFRGADPASMDRLADRFWARVMPLTYTFRCPKSHVRLANQWVPDFHAHESNEEGTIIDGGSLDSVAAKASPGDQVICRSNAPLVAAALSLIAAGKPATIRGRGFGEELIPIIRRCDAPTIAGFIARLDALESARLSALADRDGVEEERDRVADQAAILRTIACSCASTAEVQVAVFDLFVDSGHEGKVILSSIHRAKGTEARRIFLVHAGRKAGRREPTEAEIEQEENCLYVAHTRSLSELIHVHA